MFELLIATQNDHKLEEIKPLLGSRDIQLLSLNSKPNVPEIIENGNSFRENAAIKANICYEAFQQPVLADDSGLEVFALNNEPGIYSARYGGKQGDHLKNNQTLLKNMAHLSDDQRQARFICCLCYRDASGTYFFEGESRGTILKDFKGNAGFGYDPLFYVPELNKTFAELTLDEKNKRSHRGRAIINFLTFFDENIKNSV